MEGFKRNKKYLSDLLLSEKPQFLFLQEIWLPFHEQKSLSEYLPEYSFKVSTPDMFLLPEDLLQRPSHVWHGAAIGWRKDSNARIKFLESIHDRIVGVKVSISGNSLMHVSFYAPTSGQDDDFIESVSYLSEFIKRNTSAGDQVVIGTDCNCSSKSSSRRQESWKNFLELFELESKFPDNPTFHHHNQSSHSFIDTFATSKKLKTSPVAQFCTLDTPLNLSSHDPIKMSICLKKESTEMDNKYSSTYTDFDRKKIDWDKTKLQKYQQLSASALSEAMSYWNTPESLPLLSCLLSRLLVQCATMTFTPKNSRSHSSPNKQSLKVRQAQNLLKKHFKNWKQAGRPPSKKDPVRLLYTESRRHLQTTRRYEDNLRLIKQNHELMRSHQHNRNQVYASLKKARGDYSDNTTSVLDTPVGSYHGQEVLEGFAADAEHLGKSNEDSFSFNRRFYNLCKLDNLYIFEFSNEEQPKIAPMSTDQLEHILQHKLKSGKACDIYHLTVEHVRHCGTEAKQSILLFINRILLDIYYMSCPQIKLGLGTAVYKGRNKVTSLSSSYRRITVSPILGAIIDYYLDPQAEAIFRPKQSPDQLGFTSGISYLLAAIQRGECQRWALDQKLTCFGVSLDGEAAFPSVERDIQVRELYSAGERGDLLSYSRNTYRNTECHMKLQGKLSRKIREHKGNRQGHVRASGHFKVYINPCLLSLNSTTLGFQLGPICTTAVCVADDSYLLSSSQSGLQASLDLISHYADNYQIRFNADKTKIVVTGSKLDMAFYKETKPWTLKGERVRVVDSNEHLGLVVSGLDEEQKNIDANLVKCRNSLFAMLGPAFAYKCLLSPVVQNHLWKIYNLPVLVSGLSALPIRPTHTKSLAIFHNKILRGFLKLSNSSPIPALYFLFGELPVEAIIHINTLTLFHNLWSNPATTAFSMVKYILMMCKSSSTTWSNHLQLLCLKYGLPSPLSLLQTSSPWSKQSWACLVKTRVTNWHEAHLRTLAVSNSKMQYLNVQITGLSGAPHPALRNIFTSQDVKKLRHHLKFLTGDYLCNFRLALDQPNRNPACELCDAPEDTIEHILVVCRATHAVRERLLPDLLNIVSEVQPMCGILSNHAVAPILTQFVIDCSSLNLPDNFRVPAHNPLITEIYRCSRDWAFAINSERTRLLKENLTRK